MAPFHRRGVARRPPFDAGEAASGIELTARTAARGEPTMKRKTIRSRKSHEIRPGPTVGGATPADDGLPQTNLRRGQTTVHAPRGREMGTGRPNPVSHKRRSTGSLPAPTGRRRKGRGRR